MAPTTAHLVSPHNRGSLPDESWSYVEFASCIYKVSWLEPNEPTSLDSFPQIEGCNVERIELSKEMASVLQSTTLLDYGCDSCIREDQDPTHPLPIIKLAHPSKTARKQLSYEFQMLQLMAKLAIPIPKFDSEPITDVDGIFGYRIERLDKLDYANLKQYHPEIQRMLQQLHSEGLSFGDLHPGNIMQNEKGDLVFIDPACVGRVGDTIPAFIRNEIYNNMAHFHTAIDLQRLETDFS